MSLKVIFAIGCAASVAFIAPAAEAEIRIGVSLALTGPGASLGIPYKNGFQLVSKALGGEPVRYIILDDETKPDNAAKNARKFVLEDNVDAILGSNTVPANVAMTQVAAETKTPMIALGVLPPLDGDRAKWTFDVPQSTELMTGALVDDMKKKGIKTIGYIGFSDSWGDLVYNAIKKLAPEAGMKVITNERYARADASVTSQVLKVIAAKPDAVVVGGSGSPAATPHVALRERGYKGPIYHNSATVNLAFIQNGKKAVEGAIAPTGALIVPEDLPDSYPTRAVSLDFTQRYEAAFGPETRNAFAGYSYDATLLLNAAVPEAMKKAKPGTPEFRAALRDALEHVHDVIGTHGVYNLSPTNHNGLDERARVLVEVKDGEWKLMK